MADLSRIIELRIQRKDKLKRVEKVAQETCKIAKDTLQDARDNMDAYLKEVRTLEIDLLNELMNTKLFKDDFDRFREKLAAAEKKARELASAHEEAQNKLKKAEVQVKRAKRDASYIETKLNRMSQLQDLITAQNREAAIQAQDAESDDIAEMIFSSRSSR